MALDGPVTEVMVGAVKSIVTWAAEVFDGGPASLEELITELPKSVSVTVP